MYFDPMECDFLIPSCFDKNSTGKNPHCESNLFIGRFSKIAIIIIRSQRDGKVCGSSLKKISIRGFDKQMLLVGGLFTLDGTAGNTQCHDRDNE